MKLDEYDKFKLKNLIENADLIMEFLAELQIKQVKELSKTTSFEERNSFTVEEQKERERWVEYCQDVIESLLYVRSNMREMTLK